jgi:hypothetical protein
LVGGGIASRRKSRRNLPFQECQKGSRSIGLLGELPKRKLRSALACRGSKNLKKKKKNQEEPNITFGNLFHGLFLHKNATKGRKRRLVPAPALFTPLDKEGDLS